MSVEQTLQTVLTSTGTPTFLFNKPQGVTIPKIVYQRIVELPSRTMTGRSLTQDRFQVTVWSSTYETGKNIVDAVVSKLDLNVTDFLLAYLDNRIDNKEVDTNLYQMIMEFIIFSK